MNLRPELRYFAELMESELGKNDEKKGDSYKTCRFEFLCAKRKEEIREADELLAYISSFTTLNALDVISRDEAVKEFVD